MQHKSTGCWTRMPVTRHHQDDGWNMLKGLRIPTAKPFLFSTIIASREPRPILDKTSKWWLYKSGFTWSNDWICDQIFFSDQNGDGKTWRSWISSRFLVFRYNKSCSSLDDFWEICNFVWKQSGASKNPPTALLYTYIGWKIHHFGWYLPRRGFSSRHVSVLEGGYNVQSHFDTKWDIATVNPT